MSTKDDISIGDFNTIEDITNEIALSVKQKYLDEKLMLEDQRELQTKKLHTASSQQKELEVLDGTHKLEFHNKTSASLSSIEECEDGLSTVVSSIQTSDLKQTKNSNQEKNEKDWYKYLRWGASTKKSRDSENYILHNKKEMEEAEEKRNNPEIAQRSSSRLKSSFGYKDIFKYKPVDKQYIIKPKVEKQHINNYFFK